MTALDILTRNSIENNRIPSYESLLKRVRGSVKVAMVLSPDALTSWRLEKPKIFKDSIQTLKDYRLMHKYFEERDAMNLLASMFATTTEMHEEDFEAQLRQAFGNGFCQLRNSVTPTDKETYIFYYTGHGLSAKDAQEHNSYLKPFITSKDGHFFAPPDDWIDRKLSGGEIFLHTFGFADLKYILDVWNSALMNENGRMNKHLIIILDSCFSGSWAEELNKIFKKSYPFLNNNCYITLQAACGRNEETFAGYFTKFFLLFQLNFDFLRRASSEWRDLTQENKDYYINCGLPNPQLVSNYPKVKDSEDLFRVVECEDGNPMYLFSDSGFFKFCVYKAGLESYQNSCQLVEKAFKSEELNQIMESGRVTDYKLKTMQLGPFAESPFGLFLLEYSTEDERRLCIHVHFEEFPCCKVKCINVATHVLDGFYFEEKSSKFTYFSAEKGSINSSGDSAISNLVKKCEEFVGESIWEDRNKWNMRQSHRQTFKVRSHENEKLNDYLKSLVNLIQIDAPFI